ncbi:sialic acid-binding Ig-like lectin 13 isoform X1 [Rhinoraja longicauda]
MIGRSFFLLTLLQAEVSGQWTAGNPRHVTAQNGLCARIPCNYTYPSAHRNEDRTGIWYKGGKLNNKHSVAFHSGNPSQESSKFRHRTRLSGDLRDNDCSLVIDNVTQDDHGPYFFRVEFTGWIFNYHPVTRLNVIAFTDKPMIFPAKMVAGQPVNVTCSFNTTCDGTAPKLTWVTPADIPSSVSHSKTQPGDTLTYTSVLSLTPAPKHHGQDLTCKVSYPTVSSKQKLTLTVQYAPQNLSITSPNNMNSSGVSVKEGNSAAILCSVQSLPASNLTWRHLGVTLNTTRSSNELWMEFPQLAPQDAGVYQCVAQNEHGTTERDVTLTVEYAPQNLSITSPSNVNNYGVSVKEGNSAAILCSVQSFPASNLTWRHLGVTLSTTRSSNELWLKILRVTPRDTGDYQCVAENEHGTGEGTVTLVVELCGQDRTGKYVVAVIVLAVALGVVITAAIFWAARCRGKRESSVAQLKEQKAEDGPVESPYQELRLGERDLYSDLNLRHK